MPFTPTHALAILPIAAIERIPLPFSALVIGSMIPDLAIFSSWSPGYGVMHSATGLVTACLPMGLASFLLFQLVMRRPLFALLPPALRRRCADLASRRPALGPGGLARAALAVVIGASSHVFWDSFTHQGRWGSRLVPGLDETVLIVGGNAIPGFKLLQYGSTLVGLPCLALVLSAWLHRRSTSLVDEEPALGVAARVAAYLGLITVPIAAGALSWRLEGLTSHERLVHSITTSGLALVVVSLGYCLAYHAVGSRLLRSS